MIYLLNTTATRLLIGWLIFFFTIEEPFFAKAEAPVCEYDLQPTAVDSTAVGYKAVISCKGKFLAVGTGGRIDYINTSGDKNPVIAATRNNLNCIIGTGNILVAAGDNGTILISSEGQLFTKKDSGTDKNINGIAFKDDVFIAGADHGTILISKKGQSWSSRHLEVNGNILSVAANDSYFIGITDKGEIIRSNDGLNWEITDFNKVYSGYYNPCKFRKVIIGRSLISIIGKHDDGSPAVLFSTLGKVWSERALNYYDEQGTIRFLKNNLNDITYDATRDQFFVACDRGEIFSLPSCSKCSKSVIVSDCNFHSVIFKDNYLAAVGDGFSVTILKL